MKLYEFLIPVNDKKGFQFDRKIIGAFLKQVAEIAGGFTGNANDVGTLYGGWVDPKTNELYTEVNTSIRVACDLVDLEEICELAATTFNQEAIMAYEVSPEVLFFSKPDA